MAIDRVVITIDINIFMGTNMFVYRLQSYDNQQEILKQLHKKKIAYCQIDGYIYVLGLSADLRELTTQYYLQELHVTNGVSGVSVLICRIPNKYIYNEIKKHMLSELSNNMEYAIMRNVDYLYVLSSSYNIDSLCEALMQLSYLNDWYLREPVIWDLTATEGTQS